VLLPVCVIFREYPGLISIFQTHISCGYILMFLLFLLVTRWQNSAAISHPYFPASPRESLVVTTRCLCWLNQGVYNRSIVELITPHRTINYDETRKGGQGPVWAVAPLIIINICLPTVLVTIPFVIERCSRVVSTPYSCSGGPGFKFEPGDRLS
jgi:hypothetical protein